MVVAGTEISISFRVKLPVDATPEQIKAWLRFELNDNGCLPGGNPLEAEIVEPIFGTFDFEIAEGV